MLCSQAWGEAGLAGCLTVSEDTHSHSIPLGLKQKMHLNEEAGGDRGEESAGCQNSS